MAIINLNRSTIASLNLPADKKEALWWDDELTGFALRLRLDPHGKVRRTWIIQYRFAGKGRKVKLGDCNKLHVDAARKKATLLFAQILCGTDPAAEREQAKIEAERLTFEKGVKLYLDAKASEIRTTSFKAAELYLTGARYFPTLHRKPLDQIDRSDIALHLDRINADSGNATAGRARAHISALFTWCMKRGHCRDNPVVATETPKSNGARERHLSDAELRAVWNACKDDDFGKIVRLLLLTACRRQEIGGLRWSEIDLNAGTITLPKERTKNGRVHILTLPAAALDILRSIPQQASREHLFGTRAQGFVCWHAKRQLTDGLPAWTLHDLRRSVATGMAEIGVQPHIIEAALNHISGHKEGVAGTYNRSTYASERKTALARWAEHLSSIVQGSESKVVAFKAA